MGNSQSGFRGDNPGYQSTKDKVAEWVKRKKRERQRLLHAIHMSCLQTEKHCKKKAEDILMHFKTMKPLNNEFINTCIALSLSEEDMIDKKFIGYVVAMVLTYNKSKERPVQRRV